MALATQTLANAVVTPTAFAAPTTSETVTSPGVGKFLWVKVGGTATTITVTRPGTLPAGDTNPAYTTGSVTSADRIIPITGEFKDPATGNAAVTFSQVTGVTALLITVSQ